MIELGPALASKLKLTEDGTKVLWPQPTDSADDPQNVCDLTLMMLPDIPDTLSSGAPAERLCSCS